MSSIATEPIELCAADGFGLIGHHFRNENARAAILICCATAITQKYYFAFAGWLSEQGYSVLTLDYRGIGQSLNVTSVKDSKARKQDWGELDMPAALSWLHQMYPNLPKHLVGHSAGGLLFGLMPNYKLLSSVVAVGCSTGYVKQIALPYRLVAYAILKFYFPIAVKIFGYVPAKKLGWGEDLPVAVGAQWADWCLNPGYVSNAFGKEITTNYFEELYLPMLVLNVKDDPIASAKNVEAMKQLFPNTAIETIWIDPSLYGLKTVGHIGFFRQTNKVLWPKVTEWLQGFGSSLS